MLKRFFEMGDRSKINPNHEQKLRAHNPMHPGEWMKETYLFPLEIPTYKVAEALEVAPSNFSRILNGKAPVTPDMAIRLSRVLGRSPESWITMQTNWDLWQAFQNNAHEKLQRLPALSTSGKCTL